jgi:hypothetical protein
LGLHTGRRLGEKFNQLDPIGFKSNDFQTVLELGAIRLLERGGVLAMEEDVLEVVIAIIHLTKVATVH